MGSAVSTLRPTKDVVNLEEKKNKPARIPLNVALVAIVKIQSRFRFIIARKRFEILRKQIMEQRRLEEIERQARIIERDEQTLMITSTPSGVTKSGQLNTKNRFIRKLTHNQNNVNISTIEDNLNSLNKQVIEVNPKLILSKYTAIDASHIIIYPLLGFVIKSRNKQTGKKIFFNICHHETITTMTATSIREIYDTTYITHMDSTNSQFQHTERPFTATTSSIYDENINNKYHNNELYIQIVDIMLPTIEYQECLEYNQEKKNYFIKKEIKNEIAKQIIKYWNIKNNDNILDKCTYPNLTNNYYSTILPIKLNIFNNNIEYLDSALRENKEIENNIVNSYKPEVLLSSAGLRISSSSAENKKECFSLPFISEYKGWFDVVTIGKRILISGSSGSSDNITATTTAANTINNNNNNTTSSYTTNNTATKPPNRSTTAIEGLALVESTMAPSNTDFTHPITLTDRHLPASVVEVLLPSCSSGSSIGNSSRRLVPLFGSAYATQQAAMATSSSTGSGNGSSSSAAVADAHDINNTTGSSVSSTVVVAHPPLTTTSTTPTTVVGRSPRPHTITSTTATSSSISTKNTTASTIAQKSSAADSNSTTPQPPTTATTSTTTTTAQESELLKPVPSECNTTIPMYIVLCNGILFLYNRDPMRKNYYPFNPVRPALNAHLQHNNEKEKNISNIQKKLSFTIENSNKNQPLQNKNPSSELKNPTSDNKNPVLAERKAYNIPLIEYGRIMLCEDYIFTTTSSNNSTTTANSSGSSSNSSIETEHSDENYYLTFQLNNNYDNITQHNTISYIYSKFHSFFKNNNSVTIKLRSYSEYITLNAILKLHIQYNQKIKERIHHNYMKNSKFLINNILLNKKLISKTGEMILLNNSNKLFYKIENSLLYLYKRKKENEYCGEGLFRILSLFNKTVKYKNIMLSDNSSQNIVSLYYNNTSSSSSSSSTNTTSSNSSSTNTTTSSNSSSTNTTSSSSGSTNTTSSSGSSSCSNNMELVDNYGKYYIVYVVMLIHFYS